MYTRAMNGWELVLFGVIGFAMAILSSIAGGGGGFIMTPLAILLGLTPAQAVSTGKFGGLSTTIGSLFGMRGAKERASWHRIVPIMILALGVGLAVPFVIKTLDNEVYRIALGIILLLMIPIMILKKTGIKSYHPSKWQKIGGGFLLTLALVLQGVFSGGLGSLVNIVLMGMLGMTAMEATITKRWSQVILNVTIIIGVLLSGLVVWRVVLVAVPANFVGSYIGGHIAVRKGDVFIMRIMMILMFVSAILLIFG